MGQKPCVGDVVRRWAHVHTQSTHIRLRPTNKTTDKRTCHLASPYWSSTEGMNSYLTPFCSSRMGNSRRGEATYTDICWIDGNVGVLVWSIGWLVGWVGAAVGTYIHARVGPSFPHP